MKQITLLLLVTLLSEASNQWKYDESTKLAYSISNGGDIQCASLNSKDCIKGNSLKSIMNSFDNTHSLKPLECGYMHSLNDENQKTGYDNSNHWCSKLKNKVIPMKDKVYFADEKDNKLTTIDYKKMKLLENKKVEGTTLHHADVVGNTSNLKYIMAVPKGSEFVKFYNIRTNKLEKTINLTSAFKDKFQPRSGDAYNEEYKLLLLTAKNRPSAVIIDTNMLKVVGTAGFDKENSIIKDLGGDQVSGHPFWLDKNHFAILNRADRTVDIYRIEPLANGYWETICVSNIDTETSLHQLVAGEENNIFYGASEGNKYIHKAKITFFENEKNIATFNVNKFHSTIMDSSFPTDAWGGINKIVVLDETGEAIFSDCSVAFTNRDRDFKPRSGYSFEEKGEHNNFQYRKWHENLRVSRKVEHHNENRKNKTYRVFSYHLKNMAEYRKYSSILNGTNGEAILKLVKEKNLLNEMKIVENEIKFNYKNSTGIVPNFNSVSMDNSEYNDAKLLVGLKDIHFDKHRLPSRLYKFSWSSESESFKIEQSIQLADGSNHYGYLAHNIFLDPNGKMVVPVGISSDRNINHGVPFKGGIFVINLKNFKVERFIKTGKGAGHVVFDTARGHGFITHHQEPYVSMYDYNTNDIQSLKHIPLKIKNENYSLITQSHSPYIDDDNKYMYNAWTDGGVFFRIDLEKEIVDNNHKVLIKGMPIQGNYFSTASEEKFIAKDNTSITKKKLRQLISGAKYKQKKLHICIKNGAFIRNIELLEDSAISDGTRLEITNKASNTVYLEGVSPSQISSGENMVFIYEKHMWKRQ